MKRVISTLVFAAALLGLGAMAFAAMPGLGGDTAVADNVDVVADAGASTAATNNATSAYNAIGVPLDNGIYDAAQLLTDIGNNSGITPTAITKYEPGVGFVSYDPNDFFGVSYPITVGMGVFILVEGVSTDTYAFVGEVPPAGSISFDLAYNAPDVCTYNLITLPLDQGDITNTTEWTTALGGSSVVGNITQYVPGSGFISYDPNDFFATPFDVSIGYPYFVCVKSAITWPSS